MKTPKRSTRSHKEIPTLGKGRDLPKPRNHSDFSSEAHSQELRNLIFLLLEILLSSSYFLFFFQNLIRLTSISVPHFSVTNPTLSRTKGFYLLPRRLSHVCYLIDIALKMRARDPFKIHNDVIFLGSPWNKWRSENPHTL